MAHFGCKTGFLDFPRNILESFLQINRRIGKDVNRKVKAQNANLSSGPKPMKVVAMQFFHS